MIIFSLLFLIFLDAFSGINSGVSLGYFAYYLIKTILLFYLIKYSIFNYKTHLSILFFMKIRSISLQYFFDCMKKRLFFVKMHPMPRTFNPMKILLPSHLRVLLKKLLYLILLKI